MLVTKYSWSSYENTPSLKEYNCKQVTYMQLEAFNVSNPEVSLWIWLFSVYIERTCILVYVPNSHNLFSVVPLESELIICAHVYFGYVRIWKNASYRCVRVELVQFFLLPFFLLSAIIGPSSLLKPYSRPYYAIYFTFLSVSQTVYYRIVGWLVNN
jgi:hypothetical protein